MAEEMKKDEVLEEKNEGTNNEPENAGENGAENPPAPAETDGEKKENILQKAWNGLKKFGNETVKPAAKKAAPWVGGAIVGATALGGVLLKKGLDDARNEADEDDDDLDEDFDVIDTDATVVDEETSTEE